MGLLRDLWLAKRSDDRNTEAEGLLERLYGQTGDTQAYGATMQPETSTYNAETGQTFLTGGEQMPGGPIGGSGGSGLLGGAITPNQFNAQMQSGLAGIYGAEGLMQQRSLQTMRGQQQMQLQQQQQNYYANNMDAYQTAQHENAMIKTGIEAGSKGYTEWIQGNTAYRADVKPYQDALDRAESSNNLVNERGGIQNLSGPDQLAIVVDYARMTKPENLTDGDIDNIMQSFGITGGFLSWSKKLGAGGRMSDEMMKPILNAINSLRRTKEGQLEPINDKWGRLLRQRGIPIDFRRQPSQVPDYDPDALLNAMPDDVVPIQ